MENFKNIQKHILHIFWNLLFAFISISASFSWNLGRVYCWVSLGHGQNSYSDTIFKYQNSVTGNISKMNRPTLLIFPWKMSSEKGIETPCFFFQCDHACPKYWKFRSKILWIIYELVLIEMTKVKFFRSGQTMKLFSWS